MFHLKRPYTNGTMVRTKSIDHRLYGNFVNIKTFFQHEEEEEKKKKEEEENGESAKSEVTLLHLE